MKIFGVCSGGNMQIAHDKLTGAIYRCFALYWLSHSLRKFASCSKHVMTWVVCVCVCVGRSDWQMNHCSHLYLIFFISICNCFSPAVSIAVIFGVEIMVFRLAVRTSYCFLGNILIPLSPLGCLMCHTQKEPSCKILVIVVTTTKITSFIIWLNSQTVSVCVCVCNAQFKENVTGTDFVNNNLIMFVVLLNRHFYFSFFVLGTVFSLTFNLIRYCSTVDNSKTCVETGEYSYGWGEPTITVSLQVCFDVTHIFSKCDVLRNRSSSSPSSRVAPPLSFCKNLLWFVSSSV